MKTRNQARLISQQINIMAEAMSTIINLSIESTEINDRLATCYPFEESLDDLLPNVKALKQSTQRWTRMSTLFR